jgi:hypothetical protein
MLWISASMGDVNGIRRALDQGAEVNCRKFVTSTTASGLLYTMSYQIGTCLARTANGLLPLGLTHLAHVEC